MRLIPESEFRSYIPSAVSISPCRVFPLSVAEGIQGGSIFTDDSGNCGLIRHNSGFSYLWGSPDEVFLREVYGLVLCGAKLICGDERICGLFSRWGGVVLVPRNIYSYPSDTAMQAELPAGFVARKIDTDLFHRLAGRVTPVMYWDSSEQFSLGGAGICIMHGDEPAAWAFTSAVSSEEADIGIETAEGYRRRGLALAAASLTIAEVLPRRRPTWSCQQSNEGSNRTAERLGFVMIGECLMIRKA